MTNLFAYIAFVAGIATWYFWKKQPNKKYMAISAIATIIAFGLFGFLSEIKEEKQVAPSVETVVTKDSELTSSSSSVSSDVKKWNEETNAAFVNYLNEYMNKSFPNMFLARARNAGLIIITAPQEAKYYPNAELQETADNLMDMKNDLFDKWVQENGYDDTVLPVLHLESEDGTTLAKEGAWVRKMEIKID